MSLSDSLEKVQLLDSGILSVEGTNHETRMTAWPPRAWERNKEAVNWRSIRPMIRIPVGDIKKLIDSQFIGIKYDGIPKGETTKRELVTRLHWYLTIPRDIRTIVNKYNGLHWEMLSFIDQGGSSAIDIILSNPALAYALLIINHKDFYLSAGSMLMRSVLESIKPGIKQREILARMCGFPGTDAVRNIFKKIQFDAISRHNFLSLRECIQNREVMKTLSHLEKINSIVMKIVTDPELLSLSTPKLLEDAMDETDEDDLYPTIDYMLRETIFTWKRLYNDQRPLPKFHRWGQLFDRWCSLNRELMELDIIRKINELKDLPFPPPPLEGTEEIVPITSVEALVEEGKNQRHCCARYVQQILMGKNYFYKIHSSTERGTLSIEKEGDSWCLHELRLSDNKLASAQTVNSVKAWIQQEYNKQQDKSGES